MAEAFDPTKYAHQTPEYYRTEKPVLVLMHGGMIDSESYAHTPAFIKSGQAPQFITPLTHSLAAKYLRKSKYRDVCSFFQMKMEDSQKLTRTDFEILAETIKTADQSLIVITFNEKLFKFRRFTADGYPNNFFSGTNMNITLSGIETPLARL